MIPMSSLSTFFPMSALLNDCEIGENRDDKHIFRIHGTNGIFNLPTWMVDFYGIN